MANAQKLRELARDYERETRLGFTCNAVKSACGPEVLRRYKACFDFGWIAHEEHSSENEQALWNDPDCHEIRILLLCFAAALADTGDL
jgi:hypothetical protein